MSIRPLYLITALISSLLFSQASLAGKKDSDCTRPETTPAIPDGRRASKAEMKDAMVMVREYLEGNAAFRECAGALVEKSKDSGTADPNILKGAEMLINETLEMDTFVSELFNQQVRAYRLLHPSDD